MNHTRILLVKLAECGAASLASLFDQRTLGLFVAIYWRKECDNALHMIPAWKDVLEQELLTARAVNRLKAHAKQAVAFPMLLRAKPGDFPAAKRQRDISTRLLARAARKVSLAVESLPPNGEQGSV